jgi:hypothetical protein
LRKARGGQIAEGAGTDVELSFNGIKELVIAVDLDFLSGEASNYDLIVRDQTGASVFHEEIPALYLDDGRLFLRLVPRQFSDQQIYTLQLVARQSDGSDQVSGECVFQVVK